MMISVTSAQLKWISSAVERSKAVLKKHNVGGRKAQLLDTIKITEDEASAGAEVEVNVSPKQAELLVEMAAAAVSSINNSILPEYERRKTERNEDVDIYISRAKDRITMLNSLAKRLRRGK